MTIEGLVWMRDRRRREIEKRIRQRRKMNQQFPNLKSSPEKQMIIPDYQDEHDFSWYSSDERNQKHHPLFNKDVFLFKVLISCVLILLVAITFKHPSSQLEPVRSAITDVMEREFQFAVVSDWYEETFGKPLALFPQETDQGDPEINDYALPTHAVILEDFASDNQGVTIQTAKNVPVEAISDGVVRFAGQNEEFGNTVIIQHADNTETWYGQLGKINVKAYDQVKAGDIIGIVSSSNDETGAFYLAIKKDEQFIDPVQVIKFE